MHWIPENWYFANWQTQPTEWPMKMYIWMSMAIISLLVLKVLKGITEVHLGSLDVALKPCEACWAHSELLVDGLMNEMVAKSIKTTSMMLMEMQENLNVVTLFKVPIIGILEEIDPFIDEKCTSWKCAKKWAGPSPLPHLDKIQKKASFFSQENVPKCMWQF